MESELNYCRCQAQLFQTDVATYPHPLSGRDLRVWDLELGLPHGRGQLEKMKHE